MSTCILFSLPRIPTVRLLTIVVGKKLDEFEENFELVRRHIHSMKDLLTERAKEKSRTNQVIMKENIKTI